MITAWAGALMVVIGGIVFLGRILGDRFGLGRNSEVRGPELEVLQRVGVGPKQGVASVRFGGKIVLLGVGEGGVRYLCEETATEAATEGTSQPAAVALDETVTDEPGEERTWPRLLRTAKGLRLLGIALILGLGTLAAPTTVSAQAGSTPPDISSGEDFLGRLQQMGAASAGQTGPQSRADSVNAIQRAAEAMGGFPGGQDGMGSGTDMPDAFQVFEALPQMSMQFGDGTRGEPLRLTGPVGTVLFVGFLTIVPTLLLLMTSFTRILIVLHLLKQAIGAQTVPPAHLLAAMALLLTGFVMAPTLGEVNKRALEPWMAGEIETGEMFHEAAGPFRQFMARNTRPEDLNTFMALRDQPSAMSLEDVPTTVLMTAFVTSELRAAFQIGFAMFLPFLVIDLVVASVLMSMGMFMLPPVLVSLPFKLLLFVMVDGWPLVLGGVIRSFS